MKKILTLFAVLTLAVQATRAAGFLEDRFRYERGGQKYFANELRYDVFGTWATRDRENFTDDRPGFGVGANYFFTRQVGIGADTYIERFDYPNHISLSVIGRWPLEGIGLAPYAYGGGGRQFHDVSQWTGHIGGGAEFRFNSRTGVFADVRRIFADVSRDVTLFRFGVRFGY